MLPHSNANGNGQVLFTNAHLIDGTGRALPDATVVVAGEKIQSVHAGDGFEADDQPAQVLDLQGRTLLPGLILAHVHLSYSHVKDLPDLDLKAPPEVATIAAVC